MNFISNWVERLSQKPGDLLDAIYQRRLRIVSVAGWCAIPGFVITGALVSRLQPPGSNWNGLAVIPCFLGYCPAIFSWMTGWTYRLQAALLGVLLPQVGWMAILIIVAFLIQIVF